MISPISSRKRMMSLAGASEGSTVEPQLTFAGNIPRQSIHRFHQEYHFVSSQYCKPFDVISTIMRSEFHYELPKTRKARHAGFYTIDIQSPIQNLQHS